MLRFSAEDIEIDVVMSTGDLPLAESNDISNIAFKRKKIYWNPIDPNKIKGDSLWNIVRDDIAMGNLDYDQKEFEELFTESVEAGVQNKKKLGQAKKEAKKAVQAIDPKRSMNGGIVLSRIKTERKQVAEFVDKM